MSSHRNGHPRARRRLQFRLRTLLLLLLVSGPFLGWYLIPQVQRALEARREATPRRSHAQTSCTACHVNVPAGMKNPHATCPAVGLQSLGKRCVDCHQPSTAALPSPSCPALAAQTRGQRCTDCHQQSLEAP